MLAWVVIYRRHLQHSALTPSSLPTAPTPIEDPDPGLPPGALSAIALCSLSATLMEPPASVANKRLTVWLNPLNATLTKTGGGAVASDCPPSLHSTLPPIFRTLFQVAYLTTPLSAPLAKTAGCVPTIPIPKLALATPHSSLAIPPAGSILWVAI